MPIGKNAIKRVTNNGYSRVKASAPDMENSTVTEEKSAVVTEKLTPPTAAPIKLTPIKQAKQKAKDEPKAQEKPKAKAKPKATKKAEAEKAASAPKKSMEVEPEFSPVKTAERVTKKNAKAQKRQGDGYVNLGGELPYYLL